MITTYIFIFKFIDISNKKKEREEWDAQEDGDAGDANGNAEETDGGDD